MAKNSILQSFDMDALRRRRAAKNNQTDPEANITGLRQIAPEIEKLKVGETAKIHRPEGIELRSFNMSIVAKLANLTPKGLPWAGRNYDVLSDADEGERGVVYVQRGPDGEPKERKRGRGGGRRKASAPAATETNAKALETA